MKIQPHWFNRFIAGAIKSLGQLAAAADVDRKAQDAANTQTERFFQTLSDGNGLVPFNRLKFPSLMTATSTLVQHDRADWQQTVPEIQLFAALLVETCRKHSIPMYVHSAFRTKHEQNLLAAQGRSQLNYPNAPHCKGGAVDIVHCKYHWELTQTEWLTIGKIGRDLARKHNLNVVWGGDWNDNGVPVPSDPKERFWDPAHWQIASWRNLPAPQASSKPVRFTPRALLRRN